MNIVLDPTRATLTAYCLPVRRPRSPSSSGSEVVRQIDEHATRQQKAGGSHDAGSQNHWSMTRCGGIDLDARVDPSGRVFDGDRLSRVDRDLIRNSTRHMARRCEAQRARDGVRSVASPRR